MKVFLLLFVACILFKAFKAIFSEFRIYRLYRKCLAEVIHSLMVYDYAYCTDKVIYSTHPDIILYNKIERYVFGYFFALGFAVLDKIYNIDIMAFEYQNTISRSVEYATIKTLTILKEDEKLLLNAYWDYTEMCSSSKANNPVDFLEFKKLLNALITILTLPV